ncbi:MAG: GNAT family N-acetyltransferase [Erysipelotrichales bacterium]|nr:GNAT family N-acetyltransferase [Erysipelotrichales bacterium]
MKIFYQEINPDLLEKISVKYGKVAEKHIHTESGSYSLAAICDNVLIGFISTYTRNLEQPIAEEKDAYIDIIEVDAEYKRMGVATELIMQTEKWAKNAGLLQIRAWSSYDKVEAISMWRNLGYGLCPAKIWIEWCKEAVAGYYVVKQLNPINPYLNITKFIRQDLEETSSKIIQKFRLIRAKDGVYVYKCLYSNVPAVVKYFEKEEDRREILNYQILVQHEIPTIKTYALGKAIIVMEDISISNDWRLGVAEDLEDVAVAKTLAQWYFTFHEKGATVSKLDSLYFEFANITEESLKMLIQKFPEAKEVFQFILTHYDKFHKLIYKPSFTLTYNDFYWTNFIVRKDKTAALMFDYNYMGKGYRFSDLQNVGSSLSAKAKKAFVDEYNHLYLKKHGHARKESEKLEQIIDDVASTLFMLFVAFTKHEQNPNWGLDAKKKALDGTLLAKMKKLLLYLS